MNKESLQGLLIPPEVQGFNFALWFGVLCAVTALVFIFWRWLKHQKKASTIALKKLTELAKKSDPTQQNKNIQLVSVLCQGLNIKRLDQFQTLKKDEWDAFQEQINSACYSPSSDSTNVDFDALLKEAKQWLRD